MVMTLTYYLGGQSTLEDIDNLANIPPPKKQADMSGEVVAKLHLVEKHIRKNKLQVGSWWPELGVLLVRVLRHQSENIGQP